MTASANPDIFRTFIEPRPTDPLYAVGPLVARRTTESADDRPYELFSLTPKTPTIGAEVHLPFGGVKKSGNGHPSAAGLIEAVTHKTAWTVNHAEEVKMAQGLTTDIEGGPA